MGNGTSDNVMGNGTSDNVMGNGTSVIPLTLAQKIVIRETFVNYARLDTMELMLSDVPTDQKFVILEWKRERENYANGDIEMDSLKDTFIKFERAKDGIITCKCNCDILMKQKKDKRPFVPGKCGHELGTVTLPKDTSRVATEAAISKALVGIHEAFDEHLDIEFEKADLSGISGLRLHVGDCVYVDGKEGRIRGGQKDYWTFQPNIDDNESYLKKPIDGVKDNAITPKYNKWKNHNNVWSFHKGLPLRVDIVREELEDYKNFKPVKPRRLVSATLGRGEHHFDYLLGTLVLITGVAIMYFARRLFKRKAGVLIPEYQ